MKLRKFLFTLPALLLWFTLPACTAQAPTDEAVREVAVQPQQPAEQPIEQPEQPAEQPIEQPANQPTEQPIKEPEHPADRPAEQVTEQPVIQRAQYISVTASGVNIRSGASVKSGSLGYAERGGIYISYGIKNGWCKTAYRGVEAYICADYCTPVHMDTCSPATERVIEEGCALLGTRYVYGAVRYHDGAGNKLSGFDISRFDCSSLMQYIFKLGADINLGLTTRTQVLQGSAVEREAIERGDLLFFTNSSRKEREGIERVGHVALYLGEGYILHTASDYARIEKITPARAALFLCARRLI